jgi:hypothetical protein
MADLEATKQLAISLCKQNGCTEKQTAIHFKQIVHNRWNPHPPPAFIKWWSTHPEHQPYSAVRAFNTQLYRDQFKCS